MKIEFFDLRQTPSKVVSGVPEEPGGDWAVNYSKDNNVSNMLWDVLKFERLDGSNPV